MKILITGYKGFIGQNMVKALRDDHTLTYYEWGDDIPEFEGLDWVIHLGAISSTTETDVEKVMRQNHDFSCILLVACQTNHVNLQYASSASVYGLGQNFSEQAPLSPQSPYAWSKYLFDRHVRSTKFNGIRVQGFRYFNVHGPHEDHKGDQASPYYKFEKQARETGVIKLFENSDQYLRDFVHVDDVIDVHKKFFDIKESGIWNVGTGKPRSFEAVARSIAVHYDAKIEYVPMPDNIKKQYQQYTCADLTKLTQTLNGH
jgi:ADP-L-glycero-D-manno-heptose 6-epimerase